MTNAEFQLLRDRARSMIDNKGLPGTANPEGVLGARTSHRINECQLCGESIEAGDFQYTVSAPGQLRDRQPYPALHFLCHAAWQLEAARVR